MPHGCKRRNKTIHFWPAPNANSFRQTNITSHLQQAKIMQKVSYGILNDQWQLSLSMVASNIYFYSINSLFLNADFSMFSYFFSFLVRYLLRIVSTPQSQTDSSQFLRSRNIWHTSHLFIFFFIFWFFSFFLPRKAQETQESSILTIG